MSQSASDKLQTFQFLACALVLAGGWAVMFLRRGGTKAWMQAAKITFLAALLGVIVTAVTLVELQAH